MADYIYDPWHRPPIRVDRIGVRPGEHLAGLFSLVVGAALLASTAEPDLFLGIDLLPPIVFLVLGALLLVGGAASLTGLQWPRSGISVGWWVERVGCILAGTGWLGAAGVLTQIDPIPLFGFIVGAFLAVFYALRFRLLNRVELTARENTGKEGP